MRKNKERQDISKSTDKEKIKKKGLLACKSASRYDWRTFLCANFKGVPTRGCVISILINYEPNFICFFVK